MPLSIGHTRSRLRFRNNDRANRFQKRSPSAYFITDAKVIRHAMDAVRGFFSRERRARNPRERKAPRRSPRPIPKTDKWCREEDYTLKLSIGRIDARAYNSQPPAVSGGGIKW